MATEYVLNAEKIAHLRIDNHVPLKQLAREAGVNLSSLGHAIRDGREVKMNLLLNLAEAMGEDPRDIVRKKEERFEITEVHVVDIPDSEVEEMDNPLEEIKDDAHWFIETYEREAWCEEVTRLGRQL